MAPACRSRAQGRSENAQYSYPICRSLVLTLVAALVVLGGLAAQSPAAARALGPEAIELAIEEPEPVEPTYRAYIACSRSRSAAPAHRCPRGSKVAAFFESSAQVTYKICVVFPGSRRLCAGGQQAEPEVSQVNAITTQTLGRHEVIWEVGGRRIVRHFVLTA